MLVFLLYLRFYAEVDAYSVAQHALAIEHLPDFDGIVGCEEGAYYASERLEWRERVNWCVFVDGTVDAFKICAREDLWCLKIGDEESVAWW